MSRAYSAKELGDDDLFFLPLGGADEIGMNLNLYGHAGRWLMVDLGITFARGQLPGVDVVMPDPAFIEERRDELAGLVLTHAHEDHIGAVPYLWPRLRCPIYATPFTANLVRRKLAEVGLAEAAPITEVPMSGKFSVGPFEVELITLTHSIPEPNALILRTAAGTVLHTGDWKLDPEPLVGDDYDAARLEALADEDVLAMVCDSTNALVAGETGSEGDVRKRLNEIIAQCSSRVAVACFASNVARLETAIRAAEAQGRRVALVGRSMQRIVEAARETGYLFDLPPFLSEREIDYLPRNEVLLLCTGSQGEKRSALWRIAHDEHPHAFLDTADAVIFSSRVIPGNEMDIAALQNALVRRGIEVITDRDPARPVHVSGHPARDELAQMYQWVRPRLAIPVHGEARHLAAHARLAADCQVPQQIVIGNGKIVRLAPGTPSEVDTVISGRLAYDGSRLLPLDSPVFRDRQKMAYNGTALVTIPLGEDGRLERDAVIETIGLLDLGDDDGFDALAEAVVNAVRALTPRERRDDETVAEAARLALRRTANKLFGKKPVTRVHVLRPAGAGG